MSILREFWRFSRLFVSGRWGGDPAHVLLGYLFQGGEEETLPTFTRLFVSGRRGGDPAHILLGYLFQGGEEVTLPTFVSGMRGNEMTLLTIY